MAMSKIKKLLKLGQETPHTVLVSGASGFVAAHIIHEFLQNGYHVRGTIRSEGDRAKIMEVHHEFKDQLSFAIVPDIAAPGAFDEAVNGVDGVIHTASPFILDAKDYEKDLFQPATQGTLAVLQAAHNVNPDIKRVVITSSFASVLDPSQGLRPGYIYTESDWNPATKESSFDGVTAYLASKKFAEEAGWNYIKENKPNFTLAAIAPPMVYGPIMHHVSSMKRLNTSSQDIQRLIDGSATEVPPTGFWIFADVRDLAKAHLLAYEKPAAANQRYLITSGNYSFQQMCDIIRDKFPDLRDKTPEGTPGEALPPVYGVDTSKAANELGMTFTPLEKTVVDSVNSLRELEKKLGGA